MSDKESLKKLKEKEEKNIELSIKKHRITN